MQYRICGKTNERVSVLGFGCMRLPIIGDNAEHIDEAKATDMLRYAIDHGVNYVDTAYPYHGNDMMKGGQSEPFVARALCDGYREKVNLATKLPSWAVKSREQMDELLDEQLRRLETDCIDFYLVHTLTKQFWTMLLSHDLLGFLDKAKANGKVKHVGFSFHDNLETFKMIVDAYDWEFCQIQYNYLDENFQAGTEGLEYAANKGLGVIIMEPLKGGSLVNNLPSEAVEAFQNADSQYTPAQWGLKWLWNHPAVSVVLSGMTEMEQVVENVQTADEGLANALSETDLDLIANVQAIFKKRLKVNCTKCRYCMPCPAGVNIPENFSIYNSAFLTDNLPQASMMYTGTLLPEEKASSCVECGKCEQHCPQHIAIRDELKQVVATFEQQN